MKRVGYLLDKIYNKENIEEADKKARKQKKCRRAIKVHDSHKEEDNLKLSLSIKDLTYRTSKYKNKKIYEPKERLLYILPYYPDRITHHAIMNIMEPIWTNIFISNTYSCIKGRGIHKLALDLTRDLKKNAEGTKYCLKMDIRKFYPSINHEILFNIIKLKIKDKKTLFLLHEIINSADGVPIGNYLSQFFANLFLTYFDHWVKEELRCKYYYRYADDIVILSDNKNYLRNVLVAIKLYLGILDLKLKSNYQIFPVDKRGIDYVGYKFYHSHVLLRKSIKKKLFKLINKYKKGKIEKEELKIRIQSYFGWLKYCNSKNLLKKIYLETGLRFSNWRGTETIISNYYDKTIYIVEVIMYSKYYRVNFVYNGKYKFFKSKNKILYRILMENKFPKHIKIIKI